MNIVYLVLDRSGSMTHGQKLTQVKEGSLDFAKDAIRKGYKVGIIIFSSHSEEICIATNNLSVIQSKLSTITAGGSTHMCQAINLATQKLSCVTGSKIICLATDGMPNSVVGALKSAELAKKMGIQIMVIGTDDANKEFLSQIASTENMAIKVEAHELKTAFNQMSSHLALPTPK